MLTEQQQQELNALIDSRQFHTIVMIDATKPAELAVPGRQPDAVYGPIAIFLTVDEQETYRIQDSVKEIRSRTYTSPFLGDTLDFMDWYRIVEEMHRYHLSKDRDGLVAFLHQWFHLLEKDPQGRFSMTPEELKKLNTLIKSVERANRREPLEPLIKPILMWMQEYQDSIFK